MATLPADAEVLVIDNASTDGSVAFLRENYPQVRVLVNSQNLGFAGGNNSALPYVSAPYVLLLNSDVEVTPGWIEPLVATLDAHPECAAVQPKLRAQLDKAYFEYAGGSGGYLDNLGYPFCRGRIFQDVELDQGQYDDPQEVFWATGACMLIRRSVIEQIGLFDEAYFAHFEEIDFCWRAQNAGYTIRVEPRSMVFHVGGGTLDYAHPRKAFLNFRNSLLTLFKNLPLLTALLRIPIRLVLDGMAGLRGIKRGQWGYTWAIVRAHYSFYFHVFYCIRARRRIRQRPISQLGGYYPGSAILGYYLKGKKRFSDFKTRKR